MGSDHRTEIDFGTRIIGIRCTSKILAIPRTALENLSKNKFKKLQIKLICENGENYLKLTPVFDLEPVI